MKTLFLVSFLCLIIVLPVFSQDNSQKEYQNTHKVHLKNGNIFDGQITEFGTASITIITSFGTLTIPQAEIEKIEYITGDETTSGDQQVQATKPAVQTTNDPMAQFAGNFSAGFLYESRKKSMATAVGLQALGGGLLYAEKYASGSIMMLIENGMFLYPTFAKNMKDDTRTILYVAGVLLKSMNTFFTIKAVNDYNNNLAFEMGLMEDTRISKTTYDGPNFTQLAPGLSYNELLAEKSSRHNLPIGFNLRGRFKWADSYSMPLVIGGKFKRTITDHLSWENEERTESSVFAYSGLVWEYANNFYLGFSFGYSKYKVENKITFSDMGYTEDFSYFDDELMIGLYLSYEKNGIVASLEPQIQKNPKYAADPNVYIQATISYDILPVLKN